MFAEGRSSARGRVTVRVRATAFAVVVVLVASLAQVVALPRSAQAAEPGPKIPRRDLPMMTSTPAGSLKLPAPRRAEGDFTPLARKPATKKQARAAEGAPETSLVSPVDEAVVSTEMPTLKVRDVGEGVLYCFKVSTGFDGNSGSVADSGCVATPEWTVPRHVLHDGGRYTWTVATTLGEDKPVTPASWVGHFTVDQRLGDPGPAPTDKAGPVAVNLFNGNAQYKAAGPAFETVGGPAGVTFGYNSRQGGAAHGVRTSYFNDSRHNGTPDDAPVLVRSEPMVHLNTFQDKFPDRPWWDYPFPPGLDKKHHVIRWEGLFKVPVSGDFRFAGTHTDGAKIWVNGRLVYDNPNAVTRISYEDFLVAGPKADRDTSLTAGQRVPIKVELYHHSDEAPEMALWGKSTTTGRAGLRIHNWGPSMVSTQWLYTQDPPALPGGWTLGVAGSDYVKAEMLDGSVVLTDAAGGKHTWSRASQGAYKPPPDEDGVLAFDTAGRITLTQGEVVSMFNADGTLAQVASTLDGKKPAALQYRYSGAIPRLTQITDPVSGRSHTLYYNSDNSDSCYGGTAKPQGADPAPANMLCRIRYWDGSETRLWYVFDTLARIENPGASISDFNYQDRAEAKKAYDEETDPLKKEAIKESVGPIIEIRSPLAYDWLVRQPTWGNANRSLTRIWYQSRFEPEAGQQVQRVVKVTLPHPNGTPAIGFPGGHSYTYDLPGKKTNVGVIGLDDSNRSRIVSYDDAGRTLATTDVTGAIIKAEWNSKDRSTAAVDSAGRRSTTVYDHADRPTDRYGPALASCFDGQIPTSKCADKVPHTRTGYDEGLDGLSAAYYDNPHLSGVPRLFRTGVGTGNGGGADKAALSAAWGTNPPVSNPGGWSGRFTGEIQFPEAGKYGVGFTATDGVRLWIDDVLLVDGWTDKPSTKLAGTYTNKKAGNWQRIRVDYYNRSGDTGALDFTWTPPGEGVPVTVPGAKLRPRYGWATSTTTDDASGGDTERAPARRTVISYSDPAAGIDPVYGLATAKTADPGGLDLTTRTSFERPGDGYLRTVATAPPAGDITNPAKRSTTSYYGDTETRANPCEEDSPKVNQGGIAKLVTKPKPGGGPAIVTESVYDAAGRVVATRVVGEEWSCTSYDARGRVIKGRYPAFAGQPARTIVTDWAVGGDPLITRVTDASGSITTTSDLLGQTVGYTDTSGLTSTSSYDVVGRLTSDTTTVKGVSSTVAYSWNTASQLTEVKVDGTKVATPAYTDAGELASVVYGNGSRLDELTRNTSGDTTGLTWKTSESTVADTVTRSRSNRVTDDTVTVDGKTAASYSYRYDTVGRLVAATVPHHKLTYSFEETGGCGPNPAAGANTNRTAFTDSRDGATPVATTYCYDDADRLTSTSGGTTLSLSYDAHGDAVKVGADSLGYDAAKRHISTTTATGTSIAYTRDPQNRLTVRTVTGSAKAADNTATRYAYSSKADTADLILDTAGNLKQRIVPLPGGVLLTKNYDQAKTTNWSYPNIHGDVLFTADGSAARTGPIYLYDPYGRNIDPKTGEYTNVPIPSTMTGGMDYGWLGQHQRPVEHLGGQQAIEMGARTYLPILGRFLQADPVSGGSANDYEYGNADPVNNLDLAGTSAWSKLKDGVKAATKVAEVVSFVPGPIGTVAAGVAVAGYLAQGNYQAAAMNAVGLVPGGKLVGAVAKNVAQKAPELTQAAKAAACGAGNSFTPATPVAMADGTTKPIGDIKVGEQVQATDPATGTLFAAPVTQKITGKGNKHLIDISLDVPVPAQAKITATAGHPIWVHHKGWVNAGDIRPGDLIRGPPGTGLATVTSIHDRGNVGDQTVHNLTISQIHTYYVLAGATPLLVHNSGCPRFAASSDGTVADLRNPIIDPASAVPARTGKGTIYDVPPEAGLHPNVTQARIMDPVTTGRYQFPDGYTAHQNAAGQKVNPLTGQTIPNSDPYAHIPGERTHCGCRNSTGGPTI